MVELFLLILSFAVGNLYKFSFFSPDVHFSLLDISIVLILLLNLRKIRVPKFILPFTGVALISLVFAGFHFGLRPTLIGSLYLIRWFAYALFIPTARSLTQRYPKALFFLGFLTAVIGLLQYVLLPDVRFLVVSQWDPHYYRVIGSLLDPGFTGLILVFTLIFLSLQPRFNVFAWTLTYLSFILTYSRSSYLAFAISVVLISFKKKSWKFLLGSALLFALSIYSLPHPGGEGVNLERTNSIQARLLNWSQSWTIFSRHPIIGVGFDTYRYAQKEAGFLDTSTWLLSHAGAGADSSLLFVAATTGLLGFLAYLYYLKHLRSSIYYLLPLLVHSFFLNSLFYPFVLVWLAFVSTADTLP